VIWGILEEKWANKEGKGRQYLKETIWIFFSGWQLVVGVVYMKDG
jgi:hypothetical protein